jgi:subtilisin
MLKRLCLVVAACAIASVAVPAGAGADDGTPIPGQYIVVLKHGANGKGVAAEHARSAKAQVLHTYDAALHGYAAGLSPAGLAKVKADSRVAFVTQNRSAHAFQAQTLPTGVNRIDADLSPTAQLAGNGSGTATGAIDPNTGQPITSAVAVFDTGVDYLHPDLNVVGGVNCLDANDAYNNHTYGDELGHGTHVAGIIGAKDDGNGVVGVAPGVPLYSVRNGNRLGVTTTSAQLCGINWITQNGPSLGIKVVNSSQVLVGGKDDGNCGYANNDLMHQAICRSTQQAGITWVFAAGNSTVDLANTGGAGYDEVLAVTAMGDSNGQPNVGSTAKFSCKSAIQSNGNNTISGTDDTYASFSNYAVTVQDQNHTVAAPGVCLWSTFKNQSYGWMSGTSKAAPHATGVVELCILSGKCPGAPGDTIARVRSDSITYNYNNTTWGFKGDPLRPVTGKYYGVLIRAAQY